MSLINFKFKYIIQILENARKSGFLYWILEVFLFLTVWTRVSCLIQLLRRFWWDFSFFDVSWKFPTGRDFSIFVSVSKPKISGCRKQEENPESNFSPDTYQLLTPDKLFLLICQVFRWVLVGLDQGQCYF